MSKFAILPIALLLVLTTSALGQEGGSILIRNATLINQEGEHDKVTVNILIKDSKLDIITEDLIPIKDADESFDAAGGVVLGELKLGAPASFLILRGDPRQNVKLLLDTKTHATFAIHQGNVLKNTYVTILEETPEEIERAEKGWLAYAPPPLAVPLNYQDKTRWNRFSTKYVSGLFTGAVVLDRQFWVEQDDDSKFQVGDLDSFDGGEIRGLRFGGVGTLNFEKPWVWTVFGATHSFEKGFDITESDEYTLLTCAWISHCGRRPASVLVNKRNPSPWSALWPLARVRWASGPLSQTHCFLREILAWSWLARC